MTTQAPGPRYWLSPAQRLLVRAAVFEEEPAREAWRQWQVGNDLDSSDAGSHVVLARLYQNLRHLSPSDRQLPKLRGIYRHTWCRNQLVLRALAEVLRVLREGGVSVTLLNGPPLLLFHYRDAGARFLCDVDLLIRPRDVLAAADALARAGWGATLSAGPDQLPFLALSQAPVGQSTFNLRWRPFLPDCPAAVEEQFHRRTLLCKVGDVLARTPDPTDMLLLVCFRSRGLHPQATTRWVMDSLTLIGRADPPVDWEAVLTRAQAAGLLSPLHDALEYLRREFAAPVLEAVLRRAESPPATAPLPVMPAPPPNTLRGMLDWHHWLYEQVARSRRERLTPMRLLHYHLAFMPLVWRLRRRWHVLPRTLLAAARALLIGLGLRKL